MASFGRGGLRAIDAHDQQPEGSRGTSTRGRWSVRLGRPRHRWRPGDYTPRITDTAKQALEPFVADWAKALPAIERAAAQSRRRPGIQSVPARGTPAMAAASVVRATRSSGSRFSTCDLPQARARVCASRVSTCR